jgi:hypothetical protein
MRNKKFYAFILEEYKRHSLVLENVQDNEIPLFFITAANEKAHYSYAEKIVHKYEGYILSILLLYSNLLRGRNRRMLK